jgi:hypothetical protein
MQRLDRERSERRFGKIVRFIVTITWAPARIAVTSIEDAERR